MSVFDPQAPNLAGSYQNIIAGLQNRASLERSAPTPYDPATHIVTRIDQELTKQRDFEKKMAGEGRTLFTEDMANELSQHLGVPATAFKKAVNRYFSEDEFTKLVDNATMTPGLKMLEEGDKLTQEQKAALLATGEKGRAALAQNMFPKPVNASGRKTVRLEDPSGKIREIPLELVSADTDWANFQWNNFPLAGYKPTVVTDPGSGEKSNVTASGKTKPVTGPDKSRDPDGMAHEGAHLFQKQKDYLVKRLDEFNKDTDKIRGQLQSAKDIKAQLDAGVPTSDAAVKSLMPRLMREVGNLIQAEQDVYDVPRSFTLKAKQFAERGFSGLYAEEQRDFLRQTVEIAERVTAGRLAQYGDRYAAQDRDIYEDIDPDYLKRYYMSGTQEKIVLQDGKRYKVKLDANGQPIPSSAREVK